MMTIGTAYADAAFSRSARMIKSKTVSLIMTTIASIVVPYVARA